MKAQKEGALPTPCIVRKDPRVENIDVGGTGRLGVLQSVRLQRVGHNWVTEHKESDVTERLSLSLVETECLA